MPSYIELDKQASFPSSSNAGNVILGVNTLGQVTLTNNDGQTTPISGGSGSIDTGSFATTGSNTFTDSQTIVGNVTFPSSSFISTNNESGSLFFSSLNGGTLQLNADGGEGDVLVGYNGWSGSLKVRGDVEVTGSIYLGSGSIISESGSNLVFTPPTALPGQSLVIRPTAPALTSNHPSGFYSGDSITITFTPSGGTVTGTGSYIFTGCTEVQLGTPLTGSLLFNNEVTQSLTWTVPAISDITGFTFEIYNFATFASSSISLSSSGSSEHSHVHLTSGNPITTDIYLGDDNQYIKIEKNNGNVVIGTNSDANQWIFDTSGSLTTPGSVEISGSLNITGTTNIRPYKVYTALLTQNGPSNPGVWNSGNGALGDGVTFGITNDDSGTVDFTNVGAPNNNVGTFFMSTGGTPNSWGNNNNGELSFNAANPVATVLENTIGNIWFIYGFTGSYSIISDNLFTDNKTTTFGSQYNGNLGVYIYFTTGGNMTSNEIPIQVGDPSPSDGYLFNTPIEIRVYN